MNKVTGALSNLPSIHYLHLYYGHSGKGKTDLIMTKFRNCWLYWSGFCGLHFLTGSYHLENPDKIQKTPKIQISCCSFLPTTMLIDSMIGSRCATYVLNTLRCRTVGRIKCPKTVARAASGAAF